ncbi:hypothetical protein EVAR_16041_1 [Eumeta japonica]|uniref:Uncharacterized protein n=1 Tax=Eumeta variegata TaxID=151549 RepID=A0A4C1W053_EUMVA|nr:hypothetical protein EVAR_16041_1 [Eumeta japonica]
MTYGENGVCDGAESPGAVGTTYARHCQRRTLSRSTYWALWALGLKLERNWNGSFCYERIFESAVAQTQRTARHVRVYSLNFDSLSARDGYEAVYWKLSRALIEIDGGRGVCALHISRWTDPDNFQRCRVNVSDEFRVSRPSIAMNNENIDDVSCMIETDRHVTHHDIWASLDIANQTNKTLKEKNVELMSNRAYSPDLVSCHCFLFAKIKKTPKEVVEEYKKHVSKRHLVASHVRCGTAAEHVPRPRKHWRFMTVRTGHTLGRCTALCASAPPRILYAVYKPELISPEKMVLTNNEVGPAPVQFSWLVRPYRSINETRNWF